MLSFSAASQKTNSQVKENKYRINLPEYWGKGNKVWKILTDKLPQACEELKNKELCGDNCNPAYTVDFYMTEPEVTDYNKVNVNPTPSTNTQRGSYAPNAAERTNYVAGLPAPYSYYKNDVISNNNWKITVVYNFQCYLLLRDREDKIITRIILVDTNENWSKMQIVNLSQGSNFNAQTPENYIEKNKDKLAPTLNELFAIIDDKLLSL